MSTKHVRESINTLLGVLHMTIDAQMAAVGEGDGGREGGGTEGEGGGREREREITSRREANVCTVRLKYPHERIT